MMNVSKFEKAVAEKASKMTVRERYTWQKRLSARIDAAEAVGNENRAGTLSVAWMAILMGA